MMKPCSSIVLCLVVAFSSPFSRAQLSRGTYSLGGSISFSSTSLDAAPPNYTLVRIQPSGSYFIADNVDLGGHLSYVYQERQNTAGSDASRRLLMGINGHIYFPTGPVALFLGLGVSVSYSKTSVISQPSTVGLAELGFDCVIGPNLALDPSVSYTFGINAVNRVRSFSIGVGLRYFIAPAH